MSTPPDASPVGTPHGSPCTPNTPASATPVAAPTPYQKFAALSEEELVKQLIEVNLLKENHRAAFEKLEVDGKTFLNMRREEILSLDEFKVFSYGTKSKWMDLVEKLNVSCVFIVLFVDAHTLLTYFVDFTTRTCIGRI